MNSPFSVKVVKGTANGQVYDVLDYDEYDAHVKEYVERNDVAIKTSCMGEDVLLPVRKKNSTMISPGVYNDGPIDIVVMPDETNLEKFKVGNIVEMNNLDDIKDIIRLGESMKKLDEPFITTPDNITKIPILDEDQPEMKCLKMALNDKNIDLDKYAGRFQDNYPNDKRQLKNHSMTLNILKRFCKNCDIEAVLTLRDRNSDVPNPIGHEVSISLTEDFIDDDE